MRAPSLAPPQGWHYRRSLASRVILLTTVAVALAVGFVALGAYLTARAQLQASLDDSLMTRAEQAAASPALSQLSAAYPIPSAALGAGDVRIAFLDSGDGTVHTYDQGPPIVLNAESPEVQVATGDLASSMRTIASGTGQDYRVAAVPAPEEGRALLIAQSLSSQQRVLAKLGWVMLVFGSLGVLVAAIAGWAVARNGLRPVRHLTCSVEGIARTEDLTPLPVEGDDEIARLAAAFNQVLAALGGSRDRQRQLVADAGHELRTPLTSLRTNLDLLSQAEDGPDDDGAMLPPAARRELLDDVRAQIEELTTLIGDLVELAREEGAAPVVEPVDVATVTEHAASRVRLRTTDVELDLRISPWWVVGDAGSLERAVTNLLDNAVKWSPPGARVQVTLDGGRLVVDDQGPGVRPEDRAHVFERFWRSEESRAMSGSGLGLSIVQQAADRHAGTVEVAEAPGGGARFVLGLPGLATPPADVGDLTSVAGPSDAPAETPRNEPAHSSH